MSEAVEENVDEWASPPDSLDLAASAPHVWRVRLISPVPSALAARLAPDEAARAERFRFPRDRDRFITARAALRGILARYQAIEPAQIAFAYEAAGKPYLPSERAGGIAFNLSHSGDLCLIAVGLLPQVGVDIERKEPADQLDKIAARFFAPGEVETLARLPESARLDAFYVCWTRKEAFIKALGTGVAYGLERFEVSLAPGDPPRLLSLAGEPEEAAAWTLADLAPAPGYAAALAARGPVHAVRRYEWAGF